MFLKIKVNQGSRGIHRAINIKADYPDAYNNLGIALHEQGRLEDALSAIREAIKLQPNYHEAYSNMGSALHDHGSLKDSIRAFNKPFHFSLIIIGRGTAYFSHYRH